MSVAYGLSVNTLAEHYFEMSKVDAERALNIYKTFSKQTDNVVAFLGVARQYESATRIVIPKLKHAPTGLTASLEEYLNDPDFEINRRQYLAQQEAKKNGKARPFDKPKPSELPAVPSEPKAQAQTKQEPKKLEKDLIDFFASIEDVGQNQQTMAQHPPQTYPNTQFPQQQFQQQTGLFQPQTAFPQQQVASPQQYGNPFGQPNGDIFGQQQLQQPQQIQTNFTGVGFGGYTPQPQQQSYGFQPTLSSIPQNGTAAFPHQQTGEQQHRDWVQVSCNSLLGRKIQLVFEEVAVGLCVSVC